MMGCDRLQGDYFSRPVPADVPFAWMARLPLDVQSSSR
jgi:EAL domain-containing protein (putative c-di-GMP-specific phosphodiesterase class I)